MSHRSRSASSIDREVLATTGGVGITTVAAHVMRGGQGGDDGVTSDTLQRTSYGPIASEMTPSSRRGEGGCATGRYRDDVVGQGEDRIGEDRIGDDENDVNDDYGGSSKGPISHNGTTAGAAAVSGRTESSSSAGTALTAPLSISVDEAIDRLGYGRFQQQILVAAGLCFAADSMEVLLLSFLSIVLLGEWDLSGAQAASLTTFVFLGALAGTLTLGPLGDRIGRKPVFTVTACIIAIFGFATALANTYWTLVILRFFVGFGVGGLTVPFDTLAELIPQSSRGSNLLLVEYFWTAGTLLTPVAAFLTLGTMSDPSTSWRWFVILCALPCVASTIIGYRVVPESPRWLLVQGKHDTALDILRQAAGKNGLHPLDVFPPGTRLRADDAGIRHQHGHHHHPHHHDSDLGEDDDNDDNDDEHPESVWESLQELFSPLWKRTTLFLWLSWAGLAVCYYGTVLISTAVFSTSSDGPQQQPDGSESSTYSFDYGAVLASASAEIAGTTLVLFTIDRMGRVVSQSVAYAAGGVSVFMLCWLASSATASRTSLVMAAFTARLFFMGATCTTWVSTAEIFPTHLRTTGHASCNAVARVGGAISPLLLVGAVGATRDFASFLSAGVVLLVVSLLTAWATWNLPETAGRGMGRAVAATIREDNEGVFRCSHDQELPRSHPRDGSLEDAATSPTPRRARASLADPPSLS